MPLTTGSPTTHAANGDQRAGTPGDRGLDRPARPEGRVGLLGHLGEGLVDQAGARMEQDEVVLGRERVDQLQLVPRGTFW